MNRSLLLHFSVDMALRIILYFSEDLMPDQLFPLGRVVMTTNLQGKIQEANPEYWDWYGKLSLASFDHGLS